MLSIKLKGLLLLITIAASCAPSFAGRNIHDVSRETLRMTMVFVELKGSLHAVTAKAEELKEKSGFVETAPIKCYNGLCVQNLTYGK